MELRNWLQEKERKKKKALLLYKKPFLAGIPHNFLMSVFPPLKPSKTSRHQNTKTSKELEPRVSRNNLQSYKHQTTIKKGPTLVHSTSQSSSSVDLSKVDPQISKIRTSLKPQQGKNKIMSPKNESSSEEKLRSPKLTEIPMTPEQNSEITKKISPCVTLSQGLLVDDICKMHSIKQFHRQLNLQISYMMEICETWENILNQKVMPESVQQEVSCALEQARLVMSQKLLMFVSLLSRYEHPVPNTALVTTTDLHRFWYMVLMQIDNVDVRFLKLEGLCKYDSSNKPLLPSRPDAVPSPRHNGPTVPPALCRAVRPIITSRLKDLAAERRAKWPQVPEPSSVESKALDMGFPLPATTTTNSLLKAVPSNETTKSAKRKCASFAMLCTSLIGRQVGSEESAEEELNPISFSPVDHGANPGRSNFKNKPSSKKHSTKSITVGFFDESNTDFQKTSIKVDKPACDMEDSILDLGTKETKSESPICFADVENEMKEGNKNRQKSMLTRKDATKYRSSKLTRSKRKSIQIPNKHLREKVLKKQKILKEVGCDDDIDVQTPKRSSWKSPNREVV